MICARGSGHVISLIARPDIDHLLAESKRVQALRDPLVIVGELTSRRAVSTFIHEAVQASMHSEIVEKGIWACGIHQGHTILERRHLELTLGQHGLMLAQRLRIGSDANDKKTSLNARCLSVPGLHPTGAVQRAQRHVPDFVTRCVSCLDYASYKDGTLPVQK